jgi:hypothetical protein
LGYCGDCGLDVEVRMGDVEVGKTGWSGDRENKKQMKNGKESVERKRERWED